MNSRGDITRWVVPSRQGVYAWIAGDAPGVADQVPCDASRTDARAIVGRPRRWPRSIRPRSRALVVQLARNDTPHSIARVAGYRQLHVDGVGHRINLAGSDEIERLLRGFHHGIES